MFDQMKKLMEMKRQADQIKRELEAIVIETHSVAGIKMTIDGAQKFKSISLDEELLAKENKKNLEAMLLRSINHALTQSQSKAAEKMKDSVGFNFPGL